MSDTVDPALVSPIVVGVSRRTGSPEAVRWAAAEAQLRGTHVIAVTAWRGPRAPSTPGGRPPAVLATAPDDAFEEEQRRISEVLHSSVGDLESLRVSFSLRRGSPAGVLLEAAVGAQLLVLDSPRASGLSTLPKSWIVPQVVFQCPCPVVLMPPDADRDPDPSIELLDTAAAEPQIDAPAVPG
jgi:hypothetical protein